MIPHWLALALALVGLAGTLAVAIARPPWLPEAAVAAATAILLVVVGAVSIDRARQAISDLAPTIAFLAALLLLADGCRRQGLFEALGQLMARRSGDREENHVPDSMLFRSSIVRIGGSIPCP